MRSFNIFCLILAATFLIFYILYSASSENTLQSVIIYFRYGDSTPFAITYPKDPYIDEQYFPYGRDGLTLEGKRKMMDLGRKLHQRYQSFIGPTYSEELIYALSPNKTKSMMSLSLVLTGLMPPIGTQIIEDNLKWQPITYEVLSREKDDMLAYWEKCRSVYDAETIKATDEQYRSIYDHITTHSGENVTSAIEAALYYRTFKAQEAYGLQLPKWAAAVYPQPLTLVRRGLHKALAKSFSSQKYSTGRLWKYVADTFSEKMKGESKANRKFSVFSGYSNGLATLLSTLGIDGDYDYPFGSYVLVELHKIKGNFGVKVFYAEESSDNPALMPVGACGGFCPMETFVNRTNVYHPNPDVC